MRALTGNEKEGIKDATYELKRAVMECAKKYGLPQTLSALVIVTIAGFEASGIPFEKMIEIFKKAKEQVKENGR
jgi:hypothetical protein